MVRVFGETPGGQKGCLHLHRAFPYFYVPYDDDLPRDPVEAGEWLRSMAACLEKAMEMAAEARGEKTAAEGPGVGASSTVGADGSDPSARPGDGGGNTGDGGTGGGRRPFRRRRFVHDATLVRARHFYGYHHGERLFVKLQLYDPSSVQRAAAAMLSGGILNRVFQPHESHIPYILQVMVDHNLHGMGLARLRRVTFRTPVPRWPAVHRSRRPTRRLVVSHAPAGELPNRRGHVELEYEDVPPAHPGGAGGVMPQGSLAAASRGATVPESRGTEGFGPTPTTPQQCAHPTPVVPPSTDGAFPSPVSQPPPRVWTRATVPRAWTRVPPPPSPSEDEADHPSFSSLSPSPRAYGSLDSKDGWSDPPPRSANTELEVDGVVDDLLNPLDVVRTYARNPTRRVILLSLLWPRVAPSRSFSVTSQTCFPLGACDPYKEVRQPLATASTTSEGTRLVQSLVPVWEEEAARAAAAGDPAPCAPSPAPRGEVPADNHQRAMQRQVAEAAATERTLPSGSALTLDDILREERGEGWCPFGSQAGDAAVGREGGRSRSSSECPLGAQRSPGGTPQYGTSRIFASQGGGQGSVPFEGGGGEHGSQLLRIVHAANAVASPARAAFSEEQEEEGGRGSQRPGEGRVGLMKTAHAAQSPSPSQQPSQFLERRLRTEARASLMADTLEAVEAEAAAGIDRDVVVSSQLALGSHQGGPQEDEAGGDGGNLDEDNMFELLRWMMTEGGKGSGDTPVAAPTHKVVSTPEPGSATAHPCRDSSVSYPAVEAARTALKAAMASSPAAATEAVRRVRESLDAKGSPWEVTPGIRASLVAMAAGTAAREINKAQEIEVRRGSGFGRDEIGGEHAGIADDDDTLEDYIAATQKECEDIVACTPLAREELPEQAPHDTAEDDHPEDWNPTTAQQPTPIPAAKTDLPKICRLCGGDCSRTKREFGSGGYAHKSCAESERHQQRQQQLMHQDAVTRPNKRQLESAATNTGSLPIHSGGGFGDDDRIEGGDRGGCVDARDEVAETPDHSAKRPRHTLNSEAEERESETPTPTSSSRVRGTGRGHVSKICFVCGKYCGNAQQRIFSKKRGYAHLACAHSQGAARNIALVTSSSVPRQMSNLGPRTLDATSRGVDRRGVVSTDAVHHSVPIASPTSLPPDSLAPTPALAQEAEAVCEEIYPSGKDCAQAVPETPEVVGRSTGDEAALTAANEDARANGESERGEERAVADSSGVVATPSQSSDALEEAIMHTQDQEDPASATCELSTVFRADGTGDDDSHHDGTLSLVTLRLKQPPPPLAELEATMEAHGIAPVVYEKVFYGRPGDAPARPAVFSGRVFRVPTAEVSQLPPFRRDSFSLLRVHGNPLLGETGISAGGTVAGGRGAEEGRRHGGNEDLAIAPWGGVNGGVARVTQHSDLDVHVEPPRNFASEVRLWVLRPLRPPPSQRQILAWLGIEISAPGKEKEAGDDVDPGAVATPDGAGSRDLAPASASNLETAPSRHVTSPGRIQSNSRGPSATRALSFQSPAHLRLSLRLSSLASTFAGGGDAAGETVDGDFGGADARLDAWLDSLGEAEDDAGVPKAGGGRSGPAQVGLGDMDPMPGPEEYDARRRRRRGQGGDRGGDFPTQRAPRSPKYDDPAGFLETLRYYGCEAHEGDVRSSGRRSSSRSRASGKAAADAGQLAGFKEGYDPAPPRASASIGGTGGITATAATADPDQDAARVPPDLLTNAKGRTLEAGKGGADQVTSELEAPPGAIPAKHHPPAARRSRRSRRGVSRFTPPSPFGAVSTPSSDGVDFRTHGTAGSGSTANHLGVLCIEVGSGT